MHRFFAPTFDPGDDSVTLPRDEAEHLTRVLRLGAGDTIAVFDGRGHEYLARVVLASRRDVRVQLLSRVEPTVESSVRVTLAQAVLKGDKMDDVVRDAVMLGVDAIQPVITKRTEVTVAALMRGARLDRWRRVALASAKQSRRAVVPEIRTPLTFDNALEEPLPGLRLMFVEPEAFARSIEASAQTLMVTAVETQAETQRETRVEPIGALRREPVPAEAMVWIGPEGGWDRQEQVAACARGTRLVSLGPRTLRADAVAVAALSVLDFLWHE